MTSTSLRPRVAMLAVVIAAAASEPVMACAVCFGDPNSGMVRGAKAGVLVLAIVVYGVLFSIAGVAGCWILKARRMAANQPVGPHLDDHEPPIDRSEPRA